MADSVLSAIGKVETGQNASGRWFARVDLTHALITATGEDERDALYALHTTLDVTSEDAEDAKSHVDIKIDEIEADSE